MSSKDAAAPGSGAERYTESYFLEDCGGSEFFKLYGPRIVKPSQAYALQRAELAAGLQALDVGCGRGEVLYQLKEKGVEAVGVDFAEAALALARKTSKAPVLRAEAGRLPFPDRSFDRIFFLGVMDHLPDKDLEACFSEFERTLKPGGFVLATTCTNRLYYKTLTYGLRRRLAAALGLKEPRPPRSEHDAHLHVNEHGLRDLERFFARIGWRGEVSARPNDKYCVRELYGDRLPPDFPLEAAPAWRCWYGRLAARGPWKRILAREFFCKVFPGAGN